MNTFKLGGFIFTLLFVVSLLAGSFYTVDEGERAVLTTNGKVSGTADPGLHFKLPFVTAAHTISTRSLVISYDNLEAYTSDQQIATVESIAINFRIPSDRVEQVYTEYKTMEAVADRFVGRRVNAELEKVFGQYTAEKSVQQRTQLSADISKALKTVPDFAPIEIISVEVSSIAFPPEYNNRINERMGAEVEVARLKQEVLQEQQNRLKVQEQADAEAYKTRANAAAQAEATRVQGEAEAHAIREKSNALRESPNLVELTKAERWNGVLPTSMIPGSAVPFIELQK